MVFKADMMKLMTTSRGSLLILLRQRWGLRLNGGNGLIRVCIGHASFSMLFNGSSKGYFNSSRGLRQGDPLSPLLIILAMEYLSTMTSMLVEEGTLDGFKVSRMENGLMISHLQFVGVTIFFLGATMDNALALNFFLIWF